MGEARGGVGGCILEVEAFEIPPDAFDDVDLTFLKTFVLPAIIHILGFLAPPSTFQMPDSDQGTAPLAILWTLTAVTLVFLVLRLVSRYQIVEKFGADDYVYGVSAIFLLIHTCFLELAKQNGFGQPIRTLSTNHATNAIKWEMVGQSFSILGMALSKVSLGLLLLRLTVIKWHKVSIWLVMSCLMADSFATLIAFWLQCSPPRAIFDLQIRPTSVCKMDITPAAVTLGVCCMVSDFFFAIIPTFIVWGLQMKRREKIFLSCIMGLGVFAGAAGIVRTYEVANGFTENYTEDTVPLIVWSTVEQTVTLVCIGIPNLRRLYKHVFKGIEFSNGQYYKHDQGSDKREHELRSYDKHSHARSAGQPSTNDSDLNLNTRTETRIDGVNKYENNSDEHILGRVGTGSALDTYEHSSGENAIYVQKDVNIRWSDR